MKNLLFLSFVFLNLCAIAQAEENKGGFFLEPSLTYENGSSRIDYEEPLKDSSGDINGFGAGLRIGFHVYEAFFIGVDGRYSIPNFEDSTLDQNVRSSAYNLGPVVGVQMPTALGLRFWGSYILSAELDPKKDEGVDEKFTDGSGYRLGGGVKLGIVSLNLEYQMITYNDTDIEDAGIFGSGNLDDTELKNNSWILSVSFPVSL